MCRVTYGLTLTVGYGVTDSDSQIGKNTAKTPEKVMLTLLTFSCCWWNMPSALLMALGSLLDARAIRLKANRDHAVPSLFPPIKLQQWQVVGAK